MRPRILPEVGRFSSSLRDRGRAWRAADDAVPVLAEFHPSSGPSALDAHAHKGRHRVIGGGRPVVLCVPLRTGSAHVIELGPVWIEQASGQRVHELREIGQHARCDALRSTASSCLSHDPLRSTCVVTGSPFRSALIARSTLLPAIVPLNLLKTSTNSPAISVLWGSVAEKLRLGLRIDAIRSQFARNGVAIAERGSDRGDARIVVCGALTRSESWPVPQPPWVRKPDHAWHATSARGRACSATPADRGRTKFWPESGRGRRCRRRAQDPGGEQRASEPWSLP